MGKWSNTEISFLKDNAQSLSSAEIGSALQRSANAVRCFASRHNIPLRKDAWQDSEENFLKEKASSMSSGEIAKALGRSPDAVQHRASQLGISLRNPPHLRSNRKYNVNHFYFSKVNNPQKAYWLGVLWADGCVRKQSTPRGASYMIKLEVQERDRDWIHVLANDLDATYPISETHQGKAVRLRMTSKQMFDDLSMLGVIPRKTHKNKIPVLDPGLVPHFVRGLFDGDGSIYGTLKQPGVQVTNTKALCRWLLETTQGALGVGGGVYSRPSIAYVWKIGGANQVQLFASWIYHGAGRYLERKYEKFVKLGML